MVRMQASDRTRFSKPDMLALDMCFLETLQVELCTQAFTCKQYSHVYLGSNSLYVCIHVYVSDMYMYMHLNVLGEVIFKPLVCVHVSL